VVRSVEGHQRLEYPVGSVLYQTDVRAPQFLRVSHDGKLIAYFQMDEIGDFLCLSLAPITRSNCSRQGGAASAVWAGLPMARKFGSPAAMPAATRRCSRFRFRGAND